MTVAGSAPLDGAEIDCPSTGRSYVRADGFDEDRPFGAVVGSGTPTMRRDGRDVEGVLAIDHGALRIRPLITPGWGRAALSYGPFAPRPGLVASVHVTNGHHSSENVDPWPPARPLLAQWLNGCRAEPPIARLVQVLAHRRRDPYHRRVRAWLANRAAHASGATDRLVEENLAVGWLGDAAPLTATGGAPGFVVRALGAENGELGARWGSDGRGVPLVAGLQNVPLHLAVVLRGEDALFLAAGLPGARGLGPHPSFRPLAVGRAPLPPRLWAGVHQAASGQLGWGVDTRVHGVRVGHAPELAGGHAGATAALRAGRPVGAVGGCWRSERSVLLTNTAGTVGLLDARLRAPASLLIRGLDATTGWFLRLEADGATLEARLGGQVVRRERSASPLGAGAHDVRVLDDGERLQVIVDDQELLAVADPTMADATCVGVVGAADLVGSLEAFPRSIQLPASLVHEPDVDPRGSTTLVDVAFTDHHEPAGRGDRGGGGSTAGGVGAGGGRAPAWERTIGRRPFEWDGSRGLVVGPLPPRPRMGPLTKAAPLLRTTGARTAYTLPWPEPELAELEIDVAAPGAEGQGATGRAGLIFYQDRRNYLIVSTWLDDCYPGTSVSSFLRLDGFEELYDAVWTNVGRRITWGCPYRLRIGFDGETWCARVDAEPVLHRSVTDVYPSAGRLRVNRVGIVANWEFGDDTGSVFRRFSARAASAQLRPDTNGDSAVYPGDLGSVTAGATLAAIGRVPVGPGDQARAIGRSGLAQPPTSV